MFTDRKDNRFQKKLITQNTNIVNIRPSPQLSSWLRHWRKCSQLLDKAFRASTMETEAACSSKPSQRSVMLPSAMLSPTTSSATTTSFHSTLNQNEFLSLSQPYPHCTQHVQIETVNIYHGSPKQASPEKKRGPIIISTDSESDQNCWTYVALNCLDLCYIKMFKILACVFYINNNANNMTF